MKKYLCIHTGSRGEIDSVWEIDGTEVEQAVNDSYNGFVAHVGEDATEDDIEGWKSYVEEFGFMDKHEWGWSLGLGEEDNEMYIDMTHPSFLLWEETVRGKFSADEFEWEEVSDSDYWDLMDLFE